jgi:hypothetical protein
MAVLTPLSVQYNVNGKFRHQIYQLAGSPGIGNTDTIVVGINSVREVDVIPGGSITAIAIATQTPFPGQSTITFTGSASNASGNVVLDVQGN